VVWMDAVARSTQDELEKRVASGAEKILLLQGTIDHGDSTSEYGPGIAECVRDLKSRASPAKQPAHIYIAQCARALIVDRSMTRRCLHPCETGIPSAVRILTL